MTIASSVKGVWSKWIDDVAAGFKRAFARIRTVRALELREQPDGSFLVTERVRGRESAFNPSPLRLEQLGVEGAVRQALAGSHVHVLLSSSHFVFRNLDLPRGAEQFLDGVVRSQIDRLTPWAAGDAAFGWSLPASGGSEKITVTIAATARALIEPIVEAVAADSIRVSTRADETSAPIEVLARRSNQGADLRLRRRLTLGFGVSGLGFAACLATWLFVGYYYESRGAELEDQIGQRRAELMQQTGSALERAALALQLRKRTTPSAVLVIEALSKTLPDDVHLTELRIEDGKVQMVGLSQNSPALVRLIEQTGQFADATFFAPTVRDPNGSETFHIEARPGPPFARSNDN